MPKFRKKPVVIEAVRFTGKNWGEIETFVPVGKYNDDSTFDIVTLEGNMRCDVGDYVIKGVKGEFYPCKPDIFEATYDPVDDAHAFGKHTETIELDGEQIPVEDVRKR